MADATWAIPSFHGGEISKFAQGRFDKPDYRLSLNVCLNAFPAEIGPWVRRPGTRHAGTTRGGAAGRTIKFDFVQSSAVTMEFTDGYLRFRDGYAAIRTNDAQAIIGISAANPAVVETGAAHGWLTGNTVFFGDGIPATLLQRRQFLTTKIDATHFSLQDALTGANIDGATIGSIAGNTAAVIRVLELVTPYAGGAWSKIRVVQAETTAILLCGTVPPQALTVTALPNVTLNTHPVFAVAPGIFNDGPYLDPFTNGVQVTPNSKTGIVDLALAFPAYSATKAYAAGVFVTSASVNYVSLTDQNVGNTPASSPSQWAATSASAAINDGRGFLGSDIGRLVRLFSEPAAWAVGSPYAASTAASPVVVSYNPSGLPGATTYWSSLVGSNTGHAPGSDLLNWQIIPQGAAVWSWGRITGLSNLIDRALAGSASIGDMTAGGGLAAAFDGAFSQAAAASAEKVASGSTSVTITLSSYVGKNYSAASDQVIQQATVYPSNDGGLAFGVNVNVTSIILNLRGKSSIPASESDGTLLGSAAVGNTLSAVTIVSADHVTAWKYVWVEQITSADPIAGGGLPGPISYTLANAIAELSFFNPPGTGVSAGASVEILGPPLLYTTPISIWRLGVYSNTTGWPTCGTYQEGRLWLGGAVPNRFDASVSNGIVGGTINFAPTDQYGAVAANSAISYTLNSDSVNPIYWMEADLQGIIMGTKAGEWLVVAPTSGPIAPANIAARRVTRIGCADIEPRRTEHTTVFVQRYTKKLMEIFPDVYSGKFSAPNLADKAAHITRAGIVELGYQHGVTPIIWGRDGDGALFGITYKRDALTTSEPPTFYGWHRHMLGSGRKVESLCVGPSVGGDLDTLTMVTNDATGVRHVELLTDTLDELSPLTDAWFLDDAVTPTSFLPDSTPVNGAPYGGVTLYGLWHLNGKTVQVLAGGLDCGYPGENKPYVDFIVSNGSCFVPFGDGISVGSGGGLFTAEYVATGIEFVIGFTFNSDGQIVRPITPADTGARNGPALGKTRRNHQYSMLLSGTIGLSVGGDFAKMKPVPFRKANGQALGLLTLFSGVVHDTLSDDYSYDGMVAWRVSRPLPASVVAISGNIQTQDR